jgi:hypothetical protein
MDIHVLKEDTATAIIVVNMISTARDVVGRTMVLGELANIRHKANKV